MSKVVNDSSRIVGTSEIDFIPTDDNVLLAGTATNSALGFLSKKYDEGKIFTFKVIGFGSKVEDLQLGDTVKIMPGQEGIITLESNLKSFENISKMLKALKKQEYEDFVADLVTKTKSTDVEFLEYFIVKRYTVLGVYTNDKSRNALSYDGQENISNS